jgi:hypothetical protein
MADLTPFVRGMGCLHSRGLCERVERVHLTKETVSMTRVPQAWQVFFNLFP